MLLIDQNEPAEIDDLLILQGVEVQRGNYNQSPGSTLVYPDYTIWGGSRMVGISRKQVGEWLTSTDKCVEQLQREVAGPVDHLVLLIEGVMKPIGHTAMMAYSFDWARAKAFNDTHGTMPYTQRMYSVNPKHIQNEQTRLEFLGVQVVHTYSFVDTVSKLVAFHELAMKDEPNRVLERLIKPVHTAMGLTPTETKFARQLMAFDGMGEEIALTIASSFSTLMELVECWREGGTIADTLIREKKDVRTRRIGTSKERQLQAALGYPHVQTQQPEGQEDTTLSPVS